MTDEGVGRIVALTPFEDLKQTDFETPRCIDEYLHAVEIEFACSFRNKENSQIITFRAFHLKGDEDKKEAHILTLEGEGSECYLDRFSEIARYLFNGYRMVGEYTNYPAPITLNSNSEPLIKQSFQMRHPPTRKRVLETVSRFYAHKYEGIIFSRVIYKNTPQHLIQEVFRDSPSLKDKLVEEYRAIVLSENGSCSGTAKNNYDAEGKLIENLY